MKNILIFDGAMGTYYRNISNNPLPECEMANLFDRDKVLKIHREYIDAGANCIKTNTFGANSAALSAMPDVIEKVITAACELATEAVDGRDIKIFADIGPILGEHAEDILSEYKSIIDIFIENKIYNFLFETFSAPDYLVELSDYIKSKNREAFIITSFAIGPDGYTRSSYNGEALITEMASADIDAVGFNCISGPYHLLEYVKTIKLPDKFLSIMPNAGYPTVVGNRTYYADNSSYFANATSEFIDIGFSILGGCCGTTPEHIEKLVEATKNRKESVSTARPRKTIRLQTEPSENLFYKKLTSGQKVIAVEYDPPASCDIKNYMANVKKLKSVGVDAITIADCPVGRARIDSSLMAFKIKNEMDIDPIVHLTCRDRNLNATKALLLGLNVENILNLILVTGDPIPSAQRDEIKSVFNFNSALLTKYINELNEDIFTNKMITSGALNINAINFEHELRKAQNKEEMGTKVFFTQPVASQPAIDNLILARETLNAHIMGGIIPIVSHKNAVFMNEEISGIIVDNSIIGKYESVSDEVASKMAVDLSLDFIDKISSLVDGYYIITPFNRVDIVENIVRQMNTGKK